MGLLLALRCNADGPLRFDRVRSECCTLVSFRRPKARDICSRIPTRGKMTLPKIRNLPSIKAIGLLLLPWYPLIKGSATERRRLPISAFWVLFLPFPRISPANSMQRNIVERRVPPTFPGSLHRTSGRSNRARLENRPPFALAGQTVNRGHCGQQRFSNARFPISKFTKCNSAL